MAHYVFMVPEFEKKARKVNCWLISLHSFTGTMVLSAVCHDCCNMIAALADGRLTVWYYPNTVFVDKDLLSEVVFEKGRQS